MENFLQCLPRFITDARIVPTQLDLLSPRLTMLDLDREKKTSELNRFILFDR